MSRTHKSGVIAYFVSLRRLARIETANAEIAEWELRPVWKAVDHEGMDRWEHRLKVIREERKDLGARIVDILPVIDSVTTKYERADLLNINPVHRDWRERSLDRSTCLHLILDGLEDSAMHAGSDVKKGDVFHCVWPWLIRWLNTPEGIAAAQDPTNRLFTRDGPLYGFGKTANWAHLPTANNSIH